MKKELITFKGNRNGLFIYCDEKAPWEEVVQDFQTRLGGKDGDFFKGANVIFDAENRYLSANQVKHIWEIMQSNGLKVKSIMTGNKKDMQLNTLDKHVREKNLSNDDLVSKLPTLSIKRNIRSGQSVVYNGNVIVFGDVNPGAEILAAGYVMIFGDMRGTVHAGATGDEKAWVAALRLQPTQLRIANFITRAPEEEPVEPELAQICDGMIVVNEMKKYANCVDFIRRYK